MQQQEKLALDITAAKGRLLGLDAVHACASGHIGGSLSAMDIITTLYFHTMRIHPESPEDPDRDRFVLSKGHCTPALYPVLALRGYFPVGDLKYFRSIAGNLSGHAEMRHVPGVDMSTGSLGQGLSAAVGMAMAGKLDARTFRVYCMTGDGELEEGQIWEAVMAGAHFGLDNLCGVVDLNRLQIDGFTKDVMNIDPIPAKYRAFNWHVVEIDGHDMQQCLDAFEQAKSNTGRPTAIVANTIKGKGVSFMEDVAVWHGKAPNDEELAAALAELEEEAKAL